MWDSLQAGEKAAGTPGWCGQVMSLMAVWGPMGSVFTNDQTLSGPELIRNVYFVTGGALVQVDVRDLVANLDEGRGGGVEQAAGRGQGQGARQSAGGNHGEGGRRGWAEGVV